MQFSDHRTNTSTNTTALVILVGATVVFLFAISSARNMSQRNKPDSINAATAQNGSSLQSIKNIDTEGLPANLPADKVARVMKNYRHDFGSSSMQRVLIYQTNTSLDQLSADYRAWLTNHDFAIVNRDNGNNTISYVAQKNNRQLFVVISRHSNNQRVEINYVRT